MKWNYVIKFSTVVFMCVCVYLKKLHTFNLYLNALGRRKSMISTNVPEVGAGVGLFRVLIVVKFARALV